MPLSFTTTKIKKEFYKQKLYVFNCIKRRPYFSAYIILITILFKLGISPYIISAMVITGVSVFIMLKQEENKIFLKKFEAHNKIFQVIDKVIEENFYLEFYNNKEKRDKEFLKRVGNILDIIGQNRLLIKSKLSLEIYNTLKDYKDIFQEYLEAVDSGSENKVYKGELAYLKGNEILDLIKKEYHMEPFEREQTKNYLKLKKKM